MSASGMLFAVTLSACLSVVSSAPLVREPLLRENLLASTKHHSPSQHVNQSTPIGEESAVKETAFDQSKLNDVQSKPSSALIEQLSAGAMQNSSSQSNAASPKASISVSGYAGTMAKLRPEVQQSRPSRPSRLVRSAGCYGMADNSTNCPWNYVETSTGGFPAVIYNAQLLSASGRCGPAGSKFCLPTVVHCTVYTSDGGVEVQSRIVSFECGNRRHSG